MQMSRLPRALLRITQQGFPELSVAAKTRRQALEVWQATGTGAWPRGCSTCPAPRSFGGGHVVVSNPAR